jgi:O-acetyl-ADP-ribose deacetylase (regulator of RNase III)
MNVINGNIIDLAKAGKFDVIAHGCNCFNTMGGGIALQIARVWPEVKAADKRTVEGDRAKLGTCLPVRVCDNGHMFDVVNAYTQFDFWSPGVRLDYDALRSCLEWIAREYNGRRIGLPQIGAGLAGGDWTKIQAIMNETMAGQDCTLVLFI